MSAECRLWPGYINSAGYGEIHMRTRDGKTRHMLAHRLSYEMAHGAIPDGHVVRHRCDTPACVNPAHLEVGTHADNREDCVLRERHARGEGNGRAVLDEEAVRSIRASQEGHTALARRYAVDPGTIRAIRSGRTWRHVA